MAHAFENGFFVREKAWHGLGTVIETAPTSNDAIIAAGLDWIVEKKPIYDGSNNIIKGYWANTRSSDGSILGIVTDRYQIVQNKEAFEFTDSLVGEGLTYQTAGSLKGGRVVWMLGNLPPTSILGDKIIPYIAFTNSFDGTGAVQVIMTPTRIVCQNTLNFALKTAKRKWSTRHSGDFNSKVHEAQVTLGLATNYMEALNVECERLAEKRITDSKVEKILDKLYPVTDQTTERQKANIANLKENFFKCLDQDDIKQFKGTKYAVMMAATDFADHVEPARKTANFEDNRWYSVMQGHYFVDSIYKQVA